jgi:hypothetical protein
MKRSQKLDTATLDHLAFLFELSGENLLLSNPPGNVFEVLAEA